MPLLECADFPLVSVNVQKLFLDGVNNKDYIPEVDTITTIKKNQRVDFKIIEDSDKDFELKGYWRDTCASDVEDCGSTCEFDGPEPEASCENYTLDECKEYKFSITEERFRKSNFTPTEFVADQMILADVTLASYLNEQAALFLTTLGGTNVVANPYPVTALSHTEVPAVNFDSGLFSYYSLVAKRNKFRSPYLLSGINHWHDSYNAQFNALNANGKDAAAKYRTIPITHDLEDLDTAAGVNATYMIDGSALAFVNKARYTNFSQAAPMGSGTKDDLAKFSMSSNVCPGLEYDVYYYKECVNRKDTKHNFVVEVNYDFIQSPVSKCNDEHTGVLQFRCA